MSNEMYVCKYHEIFTVYVSIFSKKLVYSMNSHHK